MTRNELVELINKRKQVLSSTKHELDYRYDVCKKFVEENPRFTSTKIIDCDIWNLIYCLICANYPEFSEEEAKMYAEILESLFGDKEREEDSRKFLDLVYFSVGCCFDKEMVEYLSIKDKDERLKFVDTTEDGLESALEDVMPTEELAEKLGIDITLLHNLCKDDYDRFYNLFFIMIVYLEMNHDTEIYAETLKDLDIDMESRVVRKAKKEFVRGKYNHGKINSILNSINQLVCNEDNIIEKLKKSVFRETTGLDMALEKLDEALKKDGIILGNDVVSTIKNLEIKYAFLLFIDEHNTKYLNSLNERYELLDGKFESQIKAIFSKYKLSFNDSDVSLLTDIPLEELDEMIGILSKKYRLSSDKIMFILKNSSYEMVMSINYYVDKKYISVQYLDSNPNVFVQSTGLFETFMYNFERLNKCSVNVRLFFLNNNYLFDNNELFINNIELLYSYDLVKYLKTTSDFNFLIKEGLDKKIDRLLELGYEDYLKSNLGILNYDNLNRLELYKASNFEVESYEDFINILDDKKFIVNDQDIDNFIFNIVPYKEKVLLSCSLYDLSTFALNNRLLNFNGVLVSFPKVKRLLEEGSDLYSAITYGLILSEDEYDILMECLKGYVYKKD